MASLNLNLLDEKGEKGEVLFFFGSKGIRCSEAARRLIKVKDVFAPRFLIGFKVKCMR